MFMNEREKSINLRMMRALNRRMELDFDGRMYLMNLENGFEGEDEFDPHLNDIAQTCPVIRGLNFSHRTNDIQIDTLVVKNQDIRLYEVKHYKGSFTYENGEIYSETGTRINNPIHQIDRSEAVMTNIVKTLGLNYKVKAYTVFIGKEFTLYNAPKNERFIYFGQIEKHLQEFNQINTYSPQNHDTLMRGLMKHQVPDFRSKHIPEYQYESLRKGVACQKCSSFELLYTRKNAICCKCKNQETVLDLIHQNTEEFSLLFPNEIITTAKIYDWCGEAYDKQRISYALRKNYQIVGKRNSTVYHEPIHR